MGAPSLPHFVLGSTFFGFKPEDRVKLHENLFNMLWFADGRLSWDDLYSMPIFLRNFYVKKFNKMVEDENTRYEELVAKQKTKQPIRKPGR